MAFVLGDSLLSAFPITCLHTHFIQSSIWTTRCVANSKKEYDYSILDSPVIVLYDFARGTAIVMWPSAFC